MSKKVFKLGNTTFKGDEKDARANYEVDRQFYAEPVTFEEWCAENVEMDSQVKSKYRFKFHGRKLGAIGKTTLQRTAYNAVTLSEAKGMLYKEYEHIHFIEGWVTGIGAKKITKEEFLESSI